MNKGNNGGGGGGIIDFSSLRNRKNINTSVLSSSNNNLSNESLIIESDKSKITATKSLDSNLLNTSKISDISLSKSNISDDELNNYQNAKVRRIPKNSTIEIETSLQKERKEEISGEKEKKEKEKFAGEEEEEIFESDQSNPLLEQALKSDREHFSGGLRSDQYNPKYFTGNERNDTLFRFDTTFKHQQERNEITSNAHELEYLLQGDDSRYNTIEFIEFVKSVASFQEKPLTFYLRTRFIPQQYSEKDYQKRRNEYLEELNATSTKFNITIPSEYLREFEKKQQQEFTELQKKKKKKEDITTTTTTEEIKKEEEEIKEEKEKFRTGSAKRFSSEKELIDEKKKKKLSSENIDKTKQKLFENVIIDPIIISHANRAFFELITRSSSDDDTNNIDIFSLIITNDSEIRNFFAYYTSLIMQQTHQRKANVAYLQRDYERIRRELQQQASIFYRKWKWDSFSQEFIRKEKKTPVNQNPFSYSDWNFGL